MFSPRANPRPSRGRILLADECRDRIAQLTAEQGVTPAELSRRLGRAENYISRFLHHKVPYSLSDADRRKAARYFGVDEETYRALPPRPPRLARRW